MIFQLQCEIGDALKNNDDGEENAAEPKNTPLPFFQIFLYLLWYNEKLCQEESAKCENEPIIFPFKMSWFLV